MTYDDQDVDVDYVVDYNGDEVEACPACGNAPDYCQGHGPSSDPEGYAALVAAGWAEALHTCGKCGYSVDRAEDGTWFVYGTGTTADGLAQCPPNPDGGFYNFDGDWVETEYHTHVPAVEMENPCFVGHTPDETVEEMWARGTCGSCGTQGIGHTEDCAYGGGAL
jgi:hypothetical protein